MGGPGDRCPEHQQISPIHTAATCGEAQENKADHRNRKTGQMVRCRLRSKQNEGKDRNEYQIKPRDKAGLRRLREIQSHHIKTDPCKTAYPEQGSLRDLARAALPQMLRKHKPETDRSDSES